MAGVQSDLKMIHGVAGAYMACHLYQYQHAVSPSLSRSRALSLFSLIVSGTQTKGAEGGLIPSVLLYFHFYLLSLLWIYPGRDGRFTTRQIYSGDSRHSPALKDLMHESMQGGNDFPCSPGNGKVQGGEMC